MDYPWFQRPLIHIVKDSSIFNLDCFWIRLQGCNVVYTYLETLEPLLIHLFKTEQTIYQCNSYNRNMQIQYKNNVNIQINADYQSSLYNCQQLQITFKNQNNVQLANEVFEIYRQSTRISPPPYARPQHSCTVIYRLKIHKLLSLLNYSVSAFNFIEKE